MHLHFIVHTHAHKNHVTILSVSEAQICNLFYYSTDKCIGQWHRGSTTMHGIPDPRGSLVNEILFHTSASQSRESQFTCQTIDSREASRVKPSIKHIVFSILKLYVY